MYYVSVSCFLLFILHSFLLFCSHRFFTEVSMILFMNKADILKEKLLKSKPQQGTDASAAISPIRTNTSNQTSRPHFNSLTSSSGANGYTYVSQNHRSQIQIETNVSSMKVEEEDTTSLTSISSSGSCGSSSSQSPVKANNSLSFDRYFPEYAGDPSDVQQVQEFLIRMFDSVRRLKSKRLFSHCTTAVDTENIKIVFNDVRMTILQKNITSLMLQ